MSSSSALAILQAVAAAALVPASLALVLQTFPQHKIPVAVAIWGAVGAVAGAAGPDARCTGDREPRLAVGVLHQPARRDRQLLLGRRVLPEWREANPGRLPDGASVGMLTAGLALAAFGIVQTDDWGWASSRFAVVRGRCGRIDRRCSSGAAARVPNPVLDLTLFESQSFRWANAAMLIFAIGFSAMFLGNVLFLTGVWHYSILRAGMAISVGPLIVAVTAPLFGKLAGRVGQRRLLIPGGLIWASSGVLLINRVTLQPDYVGRYLPSVILSGLGVALCLPQLSSAAVQGLPPQRFGSGAAVSQAVRNLGATLGVAAAVAFTAGLTASTALDAFHHVWWLLVISGVTVSILTTQLPRRLPRRVDSRVSVPCRRRRCATMLQSPEPTIVSRAGNDSSMRRPGWSPMHSSPASSASISTARGRRSSACTAAISLPSRSPRQASLPVIGRSGPSPQTSCDRHSPSRRSSVSTSCEPAARSPTWR